MKKLLLIIACLLASVGTIMAQDVYTAGSFLWNGKSSAGIWKNDEFLYEELATTDYSYIAQDVLVHNGDVYWILNEFNPDNTYHEAYLYKNHTRLPMRYTTYLNALFEDEDHVYATGFYRNNNEEYGVVLRDDLTDSYYENLNDYQCWANTGKTYNHHVYVGGTKRKNNSAGTPPDYHAVIWKDGEELYTIKGKSVHLYDMDLYNGHVYSIVHDGAIKVYCDDEYLFTIEYSTSGGLYYTNWWNISVDAGVVYVAGHCDNGGTYNMAVFINGDLDPEYYYGPGKINALTANSKGLYFAGRANDGTAFIRKNTEVLPIASNCKDILGMYVNDECDGYTRPLPFIDGFETGASDWSCWSQWSTSGGTGWNRKSKTSSGGITPSEGNCYAIALYSSGASTSWLISPRLFLQPYRDQTKLSFDHRDIFGVNNQLFNIKEVLISTTDTDPSSFTQLWTGTPGLMVSDWTTVEIDLSDYQGEAVYIAFKYSGTMAWNWLVDNVRVTEEWTDIDYVFNTPYYESFEYMPGIGIAEPGYYWYVLDKDYSGGNNCWQYSEANYILYHPKAFDIQDGWLFSPSIRLEEGKEYVVEFASLLEMGSPNAANELFSVWIADEYGTTPDPNNYHPLGEVYGMEDYWFPSSFDISSHAGRNIRIAFRYEGALAPMWSLKDFKVEQKGGTPTYTVTTAVYPDWAGTIEGLMPSYTEGETCTLTAKPNDGFRFQEWLMDGVSVSTEPTYSFQVTNNVYIEAVFNEILVLYYVQTDVVPEGAGSVDGGNMGYQAGMTATLEAKANEGYVFDKWNDNSIENPRDVVVNEPLHFTAYFKSIGVNENTEPKLTLFPNPAKNSIRLKGIEDECQVLVYNSLGMLVKTVTVNAEQDIMVNDLASGLYLLRCGSQTLRFVKE